ncbi:TPM domain-containing protein [Actinomyces sp. HMSC035G02]|uniref:TPM domain-containing protein n=1 Tax=Actinomyces sp. HMSC035G02 TaxID=1739406 RepID=UPI002570CDE3|nr:TPM domain-containing protein [Actinomyces sp. HMSC035G02]
MMVTMLVGGAPAFATEPLTTSGHVTDPDGFLSDEQRETIETPAKSFYSTYTTYIDVAVIPNFSGQKPLAWCEATLEQSRSAQKGILYVVAYEDGTNVSCAGSELAKDSMTRLMLDGALSAARYKHKTTPLTPEEAVAGSRAFIDALRSDYDFRAKNAAENSKRRQEEEKRREERKKEEQKGNLVVNIFIFVLIVIVVGSNVWVWVRKEREYEYAEPPTEDTEPTPIVDTVRRDALRAAAEARRRLSEAEEQVRAAEEDWNFARAQFGSAAAEEYGRRLEAAKEAISRGFDTLKQIEQTPDSHAKRRLATSITEDLDKNLPPLQDARKEFAAQREKRSSLPTQLADARERLVEELADLERSKEELSSIAGLYTESMLASLQDNPQRAAQLLESARAALETASAHIDTDATRAASALDTAQRALTMANAQTDAIFSAKTDLDAFLERLTSSIGSVSTALTDAKRLDSSGAFSPLLDEAEAAIARGQRALVSNEDPLGALENLRDVELRLEAVLAPLMTQEEATRKAKETAQRHIRDADAALAWARKYLKDHEGSALLDVNKLMSEADEAMTEAREALDEDPLRASAAASRATTLTNRALAAPSRR